MTRSAPRWTLLGLALLTGALLLRSRATPTPVPASAPATEFSSARALVHVRAIAQRPHPTGSADNARVREYLIDQLTGLGLEPHVQEATAVGTRSPTAAHVRNVLARLPGRSPGGKALLIATHYDGVGASPAASDDGAGSAALLETLRALRAGTPLAHDVIALFTDAEESGLLGAAAFVREHPWAKDVAMTTNFEARGTEGRAFMFETGAGNLDAVRVLSTLQDVTAGSLLVTVYRMLPNDTDLSELSRLGTPALNFAFIGGVERYHTEHDDVAHLSEGSLQHHGAQMLALARAFGDGPLPRPVSGDAIFFDAPFIGIVSYPETWGVPMALLVTLLVVGFVVITARNETHWGRGLLLGAAGMLVATGVGAAVGAKLGEWITALHHATGWDGAPEWRGIYAGAIALMALATAAASWAMMRRWSSALALHCGALLLWVVLVMITTLRLPGPSYLFVWPLCAVAVAGLVNARSPDGPAALVARWVATAVAASLLIPVIQLTGGYSLPLDGPGAIAVGALVPMLAWLLAPQLEALGGERRWRSAGLILVASAVLLAQGLVTVRRSGDHPTAENLTYVTTADADSAWLMAPITAMRDGSYSASVLGPTPRLLTSLTGADSSIAWVRAAIGSAQGFALRSVPRTISDAPDVAIVTDSIIGERRRLTLRFTAPHDTRIVRATGAAFISLLAIDGRTIDGSRYRRKPSALAITFTAPPDSGFTAVVELPADSAVALRVIALSSGLPEMSTRRVPRRPEGVVAIQNGDVTVRYRRVVLPVAARPPRE